MTLRERRFAILLGGALALFVGQQIVQRAIIDPSNELKQAIANAKTEKSMLESKAPASAARNAWQQRTSWTLPTSVPEAQTTFEKDVAALLREAELTHDLVISPKPETVITKGPREGFVEISVQVRAKGRLVQLMKFLDGFYERPYVKRIDSLTLSPSLTAKTTTRGGETGIDPNLGISVLLTTLVLPELPGIESHALDATQVSDPTVAAETGMRPYLTADFPAGYASIHERNFLKVYKEPEKVVQKDPKPQPERETKPPPVKPPPPPQKQLVLVGTTAIEGKPIAYVRDENKLLDPPDQYTLNDELEDGRVVLVHPKGIVLRVTVGVGARRHSTNYFCPLGKNLRERVELTPRDYPDVYPILEQVLQRAEAG